MSAALLPSSSFAAEPVKGDIKVATQGGYARLMFKMDEPVDAQVRMSGTVLVITFKQPIDVPVDRINSNASDYVSAARRDPDGSAIRLALTRRLKVNTIPAGERLYVDLMPENWKGEFPGLPQEVIDELAARTREAEKQLRAQRGTKPPVQQTIRVKAGTQPTFTRFIFEMPDGVNVTSERNEEQVSFSFDQPVKFDLADAKAAMPQTLRAIEAETEHDFVSVHFRFNGRPEVRAFREERAMIVDIGHAGAAAAAEDAKEGTEKLALEAPETVPSAPKAEAPAVEHRSAEMKQAEQKHADAKPQPATEAMLAEVKAPAVPAHPPAAAPVASPAAVAKAEVTAPAVAAPVAPAHDGMTTVSAHRLGNTLRVDFPFSAPTPAAMFQRAGNLWLVFDTAAKINVAALSSEAGADITSTVVERLGEAIIVRMRLDRPRLVSASAELTGWTVFIGDTVTDPSRPLQVARSVVGKNRSKITIPFPEPQKVHHVADAEVGDTLLVVTALGPPRGFLKPQDFVELRALASIHGVAVQPIADDLVAETAPDKVVLSRPEGLTLSTSGLNERDSAVSNPVVFDTQTWGFDRDAPFIERQADLMHKAATAPEAKRRAARLALARFYLARDLAAEAKAVLDVAIGDERSGDDVTGIVLRAVANVLLDRPEEALKDLAHPQIGNQHDAPVWRAMAWARQGKWPEAREGFKAADSAVGTLPLELQRRSLHEAIRASIEVRDFTGAAKLIHDFETLGVPREMESSMALLAGRLDEALGRRDAALANYRTAAAAPDRKAAAQGRLRTLLMQASLGDLGRKDLIDQLEGLTTTWRGDETEAEGLQHLAHLYTEEGRARDAFHVMRTALLAHPGSDLTRKIQDEAAKTFDSLFLSGQSEAMAPVEALGLFYDYRELTPIGRRGDEMIRRLADRLVAVDLLDQAAELLQHQVSNRLQGAARAQVATRLATVYLMSRKPDKALAAIRTTRVSEVANDLREQRLLIEARALSDTGRHDLALELIAGMQGREAIRLRGDILWSAKRWGEAAEQIELHQGERWKEFTPLNPAERQDVLRAAICYALAEDAIALTRIREKFAAKMTEGPDARAFEIVTAPIGTAGVEFRKIASAIASTGTLEAFLADMRARYPDKDLPADAAKGAEIKGPETKAAAAQALPAKPATGAAGRDPASTGSIPLPRQRAQAR
ncbi:MAG: tetratricopeptide repeat protein [Pseudolabrys sp.]|nr:tetratricopeptide repeat protein [Pseudolabrys sp.]